MRRGSTAGAAGLARWTGVTEAACGNDTSLRCDRAAPGPHA